jgi:UDP-N-acetylglucosamine--N-acetylmuramyl-(pentapeptide) pyrophosphoryl-undecaprenol N-acetylglucosamine transferase
MTDKKKTIVLSAGGTGGHLFPAEALAQELLTRGYNVVIFTDKRGHAFRSLGPDVALHTVRAATLKGGVLGKIKAIINMSLGILQASFLLIKNRPSIVVGFGGYPAFPAVCAAQILGIPTVLHEQNAILGKANLWLARRSTVIATSLPDTKGIPPASRDKTIVTGNPVRAAIVAVRESIYTAPSDTMKILVTGGSQAASVFGEVVPTALALLEDDLKQRLSVMHQSKESESAQTERKYHAANISAEIKPFFNNMAERLAACHLFIGRSGASTVAEIAVAGRPAIFVPYPGHKDMQQKHNADALAGMGGAWLMLQSDFTPPALAQKLREFLKNPAMLEKAASAAKACGRPDAVKKLADVVERLSIKKGLPD